MKLRYLADTSAIVRLRDDTADSYGWDERVRSGVVYMTEVTELELGYTARSLADRYELLDDLHQTFAWCPEVDGVLPRARQVQEMLTERGEHRSAGPVDLQVAATAELARLVLLHCDHDFEVIARVTGQPVEMLGHQTTGTS